MLKSIFCAVKVKSCIAFCFFIAQLCGLDRAAYFLLGMSFWWFELGYWICCWYALLFLGGKIAVYGFVLSLQSFSVWMDWSFEVLKYQFLSRQLLCVRILFLASLWCAASRFFWNTSFTDDVQHNWNVLLFWVLAVVFLSWFWNCPIPTFSCMFYFPSCILLFV